MAANRISIKAARDKILANIKGKGPEGILTGISLPESKDQIYKRFKNLSVNEQAFPQGDGTIRISPFDDYILFTLYDEMDGHDTPMDLSNVGSLYLSFIGTSDEIRIPYFTNVQELDLSAGQVLFRISESDSKKILALDNHNFYVSCQMVSEDGTPSDQSILYQGTFLSFSEDSVETMQSKYDTLSEKSAEEIILLQEGRMILETKNGELTTENEKLYGYVQNLRGNIKSLMNTINELNKEVDSAEAAAAVAAAAQASAEANIEGLVNQLQGKTGTGVLSGIGNIGAGAIAAAAAALATNTT